MRSLRSPAVAGRRVAKCASIRGDSGKRSGKPARGGVVLVVVIVSMVVGLAYVGQMLRATRREWNRGLSGQADEQAHLLAVAGLQRGQLLWRRSAEFRDEVWDVVIDESRNKRGQVEILRVGASPQLRIEARATLYVDDTPVARYTLTENLPPKLVPQE